MKLIIKSAPPALLVTYAGAHNASFDDMDEPVKADLKRSLLNEQGWLCGYCQQIIKDPSRMKIEHHCEQSICKGRTLDYTNLMAVCEGTAGTGILHCDSQKSKYNDRNGLPIKVSPWEVAHMTAVSYSSNGLVKSSFTAHSDEMNNILHLNIGYLKESRRNIWNKLFTLSKDKAGNFNKDKMKKLTRANSIKTGGRYPVAFPGLYEYFMNKFG